MIGPSQFPRENECRDGLRWDWFVEGTIGKAYIEKRHRVLCWRCKGRGCT